MHQRNATISTGRLAGALPGFLAGLGLIALLLGEPLQLL